MDEMQQQIVQLVQAAMQGDQQANQQIEQIMQAAQQGDQQAMQIAQMIQQVAQQMQQSARNGAKLQAKVDYIKFLRGQCPDGYEMQTFRKGGAICRKCMKKAQEGMETPTTVKETDPVTAYKCGRKMKKKACGRSLKKKKNK